MAAILISIKKQYSDLIFEGSKTVERCFIYESRGSGRVVGYFTLSKTTSCSLTEAWSLTSDAGALSKTQFDIYYEGRSKSVLFYIASCHRFDKPFELSELGIKRAPQSFIYLSDAEADQLESRPSYSINERFNSI